MDGGQVLVVADSDGHHGYMDALRHARCSVIHAPGRSEALQTLAGVSPDVVVIDVALTTPTLDVSALIRDIRARVDPATSIVMLSQYVRQADRETARAAGADTYLMRPALPSALVFDVQRALILRRSGRRLSWNWPKQATVTYPPALERRRQVAAYAKR